LAESRRALFTKRSLRFSSPWCQCGDACCAVCRIASDGLIERDDLELLIKLEQLGQFSITGYCRRAVFSLAITG